MGSESAEDEVETERVRLLERRPDPFGSSCDREERVEEVLFLEFSELFPAEAGLSDERLPIAKAATATRAQAQ